jgi:hypothetical protein
MFVSEKVSYRLKRVYIGIAMGVAIWLLYASYLILANAIHTSTSVSGVELVLTPILSVQN